MCNLLGSDLSVGMQPYLHRTPLKSTGILLMEGDGSMPPLGMCVLQVSYLPQKEPSMSDFKVSHPFFPSSHVTDETHFFSTEITKLYKFKFQTHRPSNQMAVNSLYV